jgi:hypothetical protein
MVDARTSEVGTTFAILNIGSSNDTFVKVIFFYIESKGSYMKPQFNFLLGGDNHWN